jgi:hypothetical protein
VSHVSLKRLGLVATLFAALLLFAPTQGATRPRKAAAPSYVLLGWNDLGMHCYNGSFADMMVLPPYNTLVAQLIRVGDVPSIVTTDVIIEYSVPGNTYSAGKTDFWQYATRVFGLPATLPVNVGLAGKGLKGTMDAKADHFTAVGIPLTEYPDADLGTRHPFQQAILVAKDAHTGAVLATCAPVIPVSSEMNCVMCHADGADATTRYPITPTGDFQKNILALHDYLSASKYPAGHKAPLLGRRPVLCAECHADNALGAKGLPGISSLSNAMHRHHNPANAPDITPDTDGCYSCHPGMETRCLRDTMSQHFGIGCVDCHGDITRVAANPTPWLTEPRCGAPSCHGEAFGTDMPLYRESKGHGGMRCPACHDSPHAIADSREPADGEKFVALAGSSGTLKACTACHDTQPNGVFRHGAATGGYVLGSGSIAADTASGTVLAGFRVVNGNVKPTAYAAKLNVSAPAARFVFVSEGPVDVKLEGARATMSGSGIVGGRRGYRFTATAFDAQRSSMFGPDAFGLRVVRTSDGATVFRTAADPVASPSVLTIGSLEIGPR